KASLEPEDRDREVALPAGGSLRVEIEGTSDLKALGVVAGPVPAGGAGQAAPEVAEVRLTAGEPAGRFASEGLAPGRWRLRVGWMDDDHDLIEVLETREVEIRPGETTEWRLRVSASAPRRRSVRVEFVVPASWTAD